MAGCRWDTPLLADRWDYPELGSRPDTPLIGARIDNVLTFLVFIDGFIGGHGW